MQVSDAVLPQLIRTSSRQRSRAAVFQKLSRIAAEEDRRQSHLLGARRRQSARPVAHRNAILSYQWFLSEGLKELLEESRDHRLFGQKMELRILATLRSPKYDPERAAAAT